ncbi:MAG: DUF4417 domain-containing protein [Pseudomonadota bacterium]
MPRSFSQPPAWTSKPGGWDTTGTREVFASASPLGIPDLLPQDFTTLPDDFRIQPYRTKRVDERRDLCHFYLDDYRFETTWNKPNAALIHLRRYWAVMTPDFSLYPQWPVVVNQWNTYRSRWLGRWWQRQELRVIPTVNWSDEASHAYCFDGIPPGQIVTIGVPDTRRPHVVERYRAGVEAMCERLSPRLVIVYGCSPVEIDALTLEIAPDWHRLRSVSRRPKAERSKAAQLGEGAVVHRHHGVAQRGHSRPRADAPGQPPSPHG